MGLVTRRQALDRLLIDAGERAKSIQVNIRVPVELYDQLEAARGAIARTEFILTLLADALEGGKDRAIRDVLAYAAARGISPDDLKL